MTSVSFSILADLARRCPLFPQKRTLAVRLAHVRLCQ